MPLLAPPPRRSDPEVLDGSGHDPGVLDRSLAHVEAVDRWLGGARALRPHLDRLVGEARPLRVLDVGTGDGQVFRRVAARLERGGGVVLAVGLDAHPEILAAARRRGGHDDAVTLVRGDGLRLPFADGSFDLVVSTLTLHHFDAARAVAAVREMARVARSRVLVCDLERSRLHHLGARLLAGTVWRRNPITRHDGPTSVLRSFTASELETVGRQAGLGSVEVERRAFFRLVLVGTP